jgi:hypothetical protein
MTTDCHPCLNRLTKQDIGISVVLAAGALTLYVRTLAPTLLLGDSAEFQTLAATLGMAHPTGYTIYLLLGKLFTWLPIGNVAYRVNLLSACAAALAVALLYLIGRRLGIRCSAALVGPLALGVCPLFWWHAVIAEVYTLGAMFITGVLLMLFTWRHTGNWRWLFVAGLLGGLSMGVHTTVMLAAPAVLIYLLLTARRWADWAGAIAGAVAGVALALLAFLSLDARDASASFYNSTARPWLSRWDLYPSGFATPFQRISFLISAREFQWATQLVSLNVMKERLAQYWAFLRGGWPLLTIGLMAFGLVITLSRRSDRLHAAWREALVLLLIWLGLLALVLNYAVRDIYVFYIPTYVPLALLASLGASALLGRAGALLDRVAAPPVVARGTAIIGAILLLATIWPALAVVRDSAMAGRITFLDQTKFATYPYPIRASEAPHQRAVQLVGQIEDNAIIFTDWGTVFTIYYVAQVEQGRTGIAAHEWFAQNDDPAANRSVVRYIDTNLNQRPIYFTFIPDRLRPLYTFVPVGRNVQLYRITGHYNGLSSLH